jgi:peptide-methionine (S)-S-oxide reductase
MSKEIAIFACGCFWSPDYYFGKLPGVLKTRVGYTGGDSKYKNPTYEQVCTGMTGAAEAIEITFDNTKTSYNKLLDVFWKIHDPTTMNRQGPDVGTQYRSVIFYYGLEQKKIALASKMKWEKKLLDKSKKIVTEIIPVGVFYAAEDYHQKFIEKTGRACHIPGRVFKE